jgi:hypothetical protein
MTSIPESYTHAELVWHLVERIENWAIYAGRLGSFEAVRTNVRQFPPHADSWGTDGFSFNGTGALERARNEIRKQLNSKGRSNCKSRHDEDKGSVGHHAHGTALTAISGTPQ